MRILMRTSLLAAGAALTVATAAFGADGAPPVGSVESVQALARAFSPADAPRAELVYTAEVTIAPPEVVGPVPSGMQRIIPITGGRFEGPAIRGTVFSGGADWNLARNDGATSVEAVYFLRTDDNVVIKITNKGVNPSPAAGGRPSRPGFTIPTFEAPQGKYDWLNKGAFVGTLTVQRPGAVVIRVFKLV